MFTIRNVGGVSLLLFGTTFLWLTPAFATAGIRTTGTAWALANALSLLTLVGFVAATWGLFQRSGWWEAVALGSAAVGALALVPYWVAARHAGETSPGFNVAVHVLGIVGVSVLLLVPALEEWVERHVMSGG